MTTEPLKPMVPDTIEEAKPGIICEWYFDRQIVGYRIQSVSQKLLDDWMKLVLTHLDTWDKNQPYLALHDISGKGVSVQYATLSNFELMNIGITAAGRDKSTEIFDQHPDFRARVALCFNYTVSGQVSQVVTERIKGQHPAIHYKAFFNRDKALYWLSEEISPQDES
jgi:hypothetical protein